jgi:hypothetical protein
MDESNTASAVNSDRDDEGLHSPDIDLKAAIAARLDRFREEYFAQQR